MSDNRTEDFVPTPLGQILEEEKQQRMAARWRGASVNGGKRPDPGAKLLADMDASRDRQIAQLSQTAHGRKVLAGHGITVTANKTPEEGAPEEEQPDEDSPSQEGAPEEDAPEEDAPEEEQPEDGGPDGVPPEGETTEPALHRNYYEIVRYGTEEDQRRGEALVGQVQQIYDNLLNARKIPKAGPHGVEASSVQYFNYVIREPGSVNRSIHALSRAGSGNYHPTREIEFFLDGATSLRETLHSFAHELKHGDPDIIDQYGDTHAHDDPAVEAICNVYADKVVKAYFGG